MGPRVSAIDLITWSDDGRIVEFQVMARLLEATGVTQQSFSRELSLQSIAKRSVNSTESHGAIMKPRIDWTRSNTKLVQSLLAIETLIEAGGLDEKLLYLVQMRASQINGCAYCLDMHSKDARAAGETEQRLYSLEAWHETPFYSDRERAALEWTEAVTLVSATHVPDSVYEVVREHFSEEEIKTLTLAVAMINMTNRFNVALRTVPGDYKPGMLRELRQAQARAV